jgi:OOP family OmpA-OmpF porin
MAWTPLVVAIAALGAPVAPATAPVARTESASAIVVDLSTDVLFRFDSARLRPAGRAAMRRVARGVGSRRVVVTGHTDSRGGAAYNRRLSRRRARAVVGALRRSAPGGRFVVRGRGEAAPAASNARAAGRARNRRVTVEIGKRGG